MPGGVGLFAAEKGRGALGGTRTHGLSLRRAALYPTELQALDSAGRFARFLIPEHQADPD